MDDFISRHAAIEALEDAGMTNYQATGDFHGIINALTVIKNLPAAEPEPSQVARDIATIIENEQDMRVILSHPKKGKWIKGIDVPNRKPYVHLADALYCSVCHEEAYWDTDYGQQLFAYCPNCGADMREESDG